MRMPPVEKWIWLVSLSIIVSRGEEVGSSSPQQVPAMFVLGDSLVDNGNNNYLNSYAKSNFMPYGIDFIQGPTGRFSNGKTFVDLLGERLNLPYLPAHASANTARTILRGVNYASAAGGILDDTGRFLGDRISFSQQVVNFEGTLDRLRGQMDERNLTIYLSKSITVINMGSNDYINNYLLPNMYPTSQNYNPEDYANLLIDLYASQITALYTAGLRKFLLGAVGPIGCIPNQLAAASAPPVKCIARVNDEVGLFNARLRSLVETLNTNHKDAIFVYGNTYGAITEILDDPSMYGFTVPDAGCCGSGRKRGEVTCLPYSVPCANRTEYVFWDAFHPTEAVNVILAQRAYEGPPTDCYPVNLKQMIQM